MNGKIIFVSFIGNQVLAQSWCSFVHLDITYTQGDLGRMKTMMELRRTLLFYLFEIEGIFLFIARCPRSESWRTDERRVL